MVLPFPTPSRHAQRADRNALSELLAQLHEADDDAGLQAAVARIEDGERQAVIASLQRLCDMLAQAPAAERAYIPY
jgi:ABC-type iron transport system FetAB ATPase subunit